MKTLLTVIAALAWFAAQGQNGDKKSVVIGSMTRKPNALLIVNPPASDQGVLLPQLSTGQRMSLKPSSPSEDGLMVFDTNVQSYYYWTDGAWSRIDASNNKQNSYYSIDPSAFRHLRANGMAAGDNLAVFEADNTFVTALADGLGEEVIAPINLPDGAVIREMTLMYWDDDDNENVTLKLMRKELAGNNQTMINWESSGATSSVRTETFSDFQGMEKVDSENFTYRVVIIFDIKAEDLIDDPLDARQRIYGIRIKYHL